MKCRKTQAPTDNVDAGAVVNGMTNAWRYTIFFFEINNPIGKDPIRLDLSGTTESKKLWRKVALTNLGTEVKELKNLK